MNCETIREQFSSFIDGELESAENDRVERHVVDCDVCQTELIELQRLDVRLQTLTVPATLQTRVRAAVAAGNSVATNTLRPSRGYHKRVFVTIVGIAATIVLAVFLLPSNERNPDVQAPSVAAVVRSIGNVQVKSLDADAWLNVDGLSMRLVSGSRIRTPAQGACEIETVDKAQLRLDADTELIIRDSSHMQLLRGQVWCQASPLTSVTLDTASRDAAAPASDAFVCPAATELQVSVDRQESAVVGTEAKAKVWQLPLLAMQGSDESELTSLVETLLANVGRSKMQFMDEAQIRALGPRGAIPLLIYVRGKSSIEEPAVRQRAMQIAAELADDSAIELLRKLAADRDPQIHGLAQAAIERLAP